MSREKQIEELQLEIIRWGENADRTGNYSYNLSEHLVDNGYRKASEVAREMCGMLREDLKGEVDMEYLERLLTIYEKKKYTGEGK